jgi:hypothetical protein
MNKRVLTKDIKKINEEISEIENLLKEAVCFHEEDEVGMDEPEMDEMEMDEPEMGDDIDINEPTPVKGGASIDSYIDHIRKYSLNGLSALCDNPESEEYQMLKKIFQMCDKKPEKKEGMNESHRIFGVLKGSNKVLFETYIKDSKELKNKKKAIVNESKKRGINPSNIRLISENKIII